MTCSEQPEAGCASCNTARSTQIVEVCIKNDICQNADAHTPLCFHLQMPSLQEMILPADSQIVAALIVLHTPTIQLFALDHLQLMCGESYSAYVDS